MMYKYHQKLFNNNYTYSNQLGQNKLVMLQQISEKDILVSKQFSKFIISERNSRQSPQSKESEQELEHEWARQMQEYFVGLEQNYLRQQKQCYQFTLEDKETTLTLQRDSTFSCEFLKQLTNQMSIKGSDFSILWQLWNTPSNRTFAQSIEFIIRPDNWVIYKYEYSKPLQNFVQLCVAKIQLIPFSNKIYPGLKQLISKIEAVLELQRNDKKIKTQENNSDVLFQHFLKEIQSKSKRQGAYYITVDPKKETKVPIGEFIASSDLFSRKHAWSQIFFRAATHKRDQIQEDKKITEDMRKENQNRDIMKNHALHCQESVFPADSYLCCAEHFYFSSRIYDRMITICPVLVGRNFGTLINSEKGLEEIKEVTLDICGLLNSGGGVILFNVFKNYLEICPKGEIIYSPQFEEAKTKIQKEIVNIYPRVKLNKEIVVTFVPVLRNPILHGFEGESYEKSYIEGLYVMRIVVRPQEEVSELVYYYKRQDSFKIAVVKNNSREILMPRQYTRLIKKKFNYFYIPKEDYDDQQQRMMLKRPYSLFYNHPKCRKPGLGSPIQKKLEVLPNNLGDEQIERKYKYVSLLVAQKHNYQIIQQRLKARGLDCMLVLRYNNYRFRAANNSIFLFHNCRFDVLLNETAYKRDFEFDGKFILTIYVTKYIKLTDRNESKLLPEDDFNSLQTWLKTEHPNQSLQLYRFQLQENNKFQFYLKTQSKFSTLFMYYVLNHYHEKATFKNPKELEYMSQSESQRRLTLFYPRSR